MNWARVKTWLSYRGIVKVSHVKPVEISVKNPEILNLKNYELEPKKEFWDSFPKAALPLKANSRIVVSELEDMLSKNKDKLKKTVMKRGQTTVKNLKFGAGAYQKTKLPPCYVKNAKNAYQYGTATTDTIATWIKKGFASGPFNSPPVSSFRVNCLMALAQGHKVRPVLNASLPENLSFNSNVELNEMEKVQMCSARCFSYSVAEAGKFAWMAKIDMCDAYKNVPAKIEDLRLQGFAWLGKFFVETRQIFGARTAVANFDILGNTILELTLSKCKINRELVHRQLDDVPVVAPFKNKEWVIEFSREYKEICNKLDILLATDCPEYDKAFSCSQYGKVLGIWFNTKDLTWSYPEEKTDRVLRNIEMVLKAESVSLIDMQKLMGRLNDIALMCPFLRGFKGPLNTCLGWLQCNEGQSAVLSCQAKRDLLVWVGFLQDPEVWIPISPRPINPTLSRMEFTSDAAGFGADNDSNKQIGVGSIGLDEDGKIVFATQVFWPEEFKTAKDEMGKRFGDKTTTLEMIGLLLPVLLCPELLSGKHVILKVDNISCYYGWKNKAISGDKTASVLVRALLVLSAYISCYIHVQHLPRMSSWDAIVCDNMSRKSTTGPKEKGLLDKFNKECPEVLKNWLKNPIEDWELVNRMLDYVERKI